MSAVPERVEAVGSTPCPVCGTATTAADDRCPECHCDLAGTGGRVMFSKVAMVWTILTFLVVYALVVAVVVSSN